MKGKWILLGSMAAVLVLALAMDLTQAQGPEPEGETGFAGRLANPAASTTLCPVADAWVNYLLPNNNYGSAAQLEVGSEECSGQEFPDRERALIRFRVRANNNDGVWNEAGLAMRVVITSPFWRTLWFRALVALVILGVVAVIAVVLMRYVQTLQRSEERFRTLFEQSPVGLCEADLAQHPPRLVHANPAFLRLFGRTPESISGMLVDSLLAPQSRPVLDQLCRMTASGEPDMVDAIALRADGTAFPARLRAAVGPGRAADRCILVVEDLTMEKALRSEEEAIAEERRRIAREIHDGLAQDLVALRTRTRLWHELVDHAPHQMHAEIDALRDLLNDNIREVRRAIFALRPMTLDEQGLYPSLRRFAAEFAEQSRLHVDLEVKGREVRLPAFLEAVLFRIVQETLHNVAWHAQASKVSVELNVEEAETVRLTVRDDGVGFDPALLPEMARQGHLGLKQMRERVEALGGRIAVCSQPGKGTEIRVVLRRC